MQQEQNTTWATASMTCGILGLILFLAPYFGIIFSICAIIFYAYQKSESKALKQEVPTRATSGLVMGIIGVAINAIMLILVVLVWSLF